MEPSRFVLDDDHVDRLPEPVVGIATRIEATDGSTQTHPSISRLIQGHLEGTAWNLVLDIS